MPLMVAGAVVHGVPQDDTVLWVRCCSSEASRWVMTAWPGFVPFSAPGGSCRARTEAESAGKNSPQGRPQCKEDVAK